MTNYNDIIIKGVVNYLEFLVDYLNNSDRKGYTLKLVSTKVVPMTDADLSDLLMSDQTLESEIKVTITATSEDGNVTTFEDSVFVPTMINNVFIIEGKKRVCTNVINNSSICRLYNDNIIFDSERSILLGTRKSYLPAEFTIRFTDMNGDPQAVPALDENYEIYKNFLKLEPDQIWRLKVKLDSDNVPEYITEDLVHRLFDLGPDLVNDSIVDKKITTIAEDFNNLLSWGNSKWSLTRLIAKDWWKLGYINLKPLTSKIRQYFRTAQTKCLEIPSTINPLIYDSLRYKVSLPANVMYNQSFIDLIDASNTPENNNVNILNELNVATSIENGVIYYKCYDFKTKELMKLQYLEYLTKPVLKCDYWDYDKMDFKEGVDEVVYRLRLKDYKTTKKDASDLISLIEPKPDDRLSYTTRRIPLVNMSDSVRVSMGASMIKQAIQTQGCEPRLVSSGNDFIDTRSSVNLIPYSGLNEGTVIDIKGNKVIIKDDTTELPVPMIIPNPIVGANDSLMTYESIVKVGDKVKPGQVVIAPRTMKNDTYNLGINANAVYMNYIGKTYEDGVVVSESYAKKATHYSMVTVIARVKSRDQIRAIAKIGQRVNSKDVLIRSISTLQVRESMSNMLKGGKGDSVFKALELNTNSKDVLVPNNTDEGYITDIKIINNPDENFQLMDYSKDIIEKWSRNNYSNDYNILPEEYRNIKSPEEFDDFGNAACIISITIVRVNRLKIGDKSSNTWGGKGIISLIVPDELMPRLAENGRPFDIIMNPAAVIARKNISQLYECLLTKIIHAIHNFVVFSIEHDDLNRKWLEKYYGDRFTKMTDEEYIRASKSINNFIMDVGSYAKIDYNTVMEWADEWDVHEAEEVFVPDVVIYEGKEGTKVCSPEYAKEHNIKGKLYELGYTDEPVVCGESYMYKLYHAADYVGKCTPTESRNDQPKLGKGLYRPEGQKIGEMESWALMSYGVPQVITKDNPEIVREEHLFLNELLLTGFVVMDQYGLPFESSVRNKLIRK